jgi:hypothetical protein
MPERWERSLQSLKEVDAPARVSARVDEGPRGQGEPGPSPARRAVTIVVAFAVFAAAGAFAWRAFDTDPTTNVVGPSGELPTLAVRFDRSETRMEGAEDLARIDTMIDYGDVHEDDFTSTTPKGAIVDWIGAQDLTPLVPGPAAGSPVSISADGRDPRILIGTPGDWPSFDSFDRIDRLPSTPGAYVLLFEADYPEGTAMTARRVQVVEPGALQLVLTEGGKVDAATARAYVDGRATGGVLSSSTFAQSDVVLSSQPREPDFGSRSPLQVADGARILLSTPTDHASAAVVDAYRETPADLPIDLVDGGATVDAGIGDHLLAVDATWQHGQVGWTATEGTRETARFFFPIDVQPVVGSVAPAVADGPSAVAEFHVGDLNGIGASGTLTAAGRTIDGTVGSYCWTFEGGSGCADAVAPSFVAEDFLDVEVGSTLVIEGDAPSVSGELDLAGDFPFERVEDLFDLVTFDQEPGTYVLAVVAHAEQGEVPFYFPIRLVAAAADAPAPSSPRSSVSVVPDVVGMTELDAYIALRSQGFVPLASYLPFNDAPIGTVAETQPPAGTEVDANTTVNMNVQGSTRDNDYSGTSWVDAAIAGDSRYIGSFVDPGGIPVAVVSSRTRAEVRGDLDSIAAGRPFFTLVCVSVTRADLDATLAELRDPATAPMPATVDARMFVDPASCAVAIDQRDVTESQGSFLVSTYRGLVGIRDLRGVEAATRG